MCMYVWIQDLCDAVEAHEYLKERSQVSTGHPKSKSKSQTQTQTRIRARARARALGASDAMPEVLNTVREGCGVR